MRWHCARDHYGTSLLIGPRPLTFDSFGTWMLDQISHTERVWRWLCRVGFLDAEAEGGLAFWRWDYWNAHMAAEIRRIEREQWERKRASAIARWGEGAG